MRTKKLLKVGLALVEDGRLLVVRKKGTTAFILPGGKPEDGERDIDALRRELLEELGCELVCARFEGSFTDTAADMESTEVTVLLYAGEIQGRPHPAAEIEELAWVSLGATASHLPLAPSIARQILPHLRAQSFLHADLPA